MKPKLLDLFCCEGGASKGYADAGFDVYGVDLFEDYTQKRYPYPSHRGDVLTFLTEGVGWFDYHGLEGSEGLRVTDFDAIVASPPCQKYSITNHNGRDYPDLIPPVREALQAIGLPYVIENVVGAPLNDPTMLCWTMFNEPGSVLDDDGTPLQMFRHRLFETNFPLPQLECKHDPEVQVAGSYGGARRDKWEARHVRRGGYVPSKWVQQRLLGIDWATQKGMHQSIPPCYTQWIGTALLDIIGTEAA